MNKALQMMFWGYLFVFFRIHIGFDWLADPIGYYLLFTGSAKLADNYPLPFNLYQSIGNPSYRLGNVCLRFAHFKTDCRLFSICRFEKHCH